MDPEALLKLHSKAYRWAERVAATDWKRIDPLFRKRFVKLILSECSRALYPTHKESIDIINSHFQHLKS